MPDLLLELFSEEIPARMQARAAADLKRLVTDALVERGLVYEGALAFATPRRLALHVAGLPVKGKDVVEERRGPRVGAPEGAIKGFLKSAGLADIAQATIVQDKKGDVYAARVEKPGEATLAAIADIVPKVVSSFPWPKSMRFGPQSIAPDSLRWVRPLRSILATFGPETEEPEVVRFDIGGIASGDLTFGHRVMGPRGPIKVRRFDDYVASLEKAKVVLDASRRRDIILADAKNLAFAQGLELVEDEALADEVAGLVEWPVVLMGSFDEAFLAIPPEVIRATIRANQKCFVLRSPSPRVSGGEGLGVGGGAASPNAGGSEQPPTPALPATRSASGRRESLLANRFILTANLEATDGGRAIVAGNERVVRARLSDAKYFWETDQWPLPDYADKAEKPLDQRLEKIKALNIVFHEKLGTQYERVQRIAALARELAHATGADPELAERAAMLAKADLVTEMVGEFPELQGLMGRYYATLQDEHPSVAAAIGEHYKPQGPTDRVPVDPVSVAVALADKLDTLVGFWAIDEKPTGSKDPYALRRAALGVIRLVIENGVRLPLFAVFYEIQARYAAFVGWRQGAILPATEWARASRTPIGTIAGPSPEFREIEANQAYWIAISDLLSFFADRLKVLLREQGARHDLVDAVFALGQPSVIPGERPKAAREGNPGSKDQAGFPSPRDATHRSAGTDTGGPQDDLLMIVRRVEALGAFLDTDNGKNLLAGYRRAANIVTIEEKKDSAANGSPVSYDAAPDLALVEARGLPEEKALAYALDAAAEAARAHVASEDFAGAMGVLAELRPAVDAFFDKVTVNDADPELRANRLRLLSGLRRAVHEVADFSKIAG